MDETTIERRQRELEDRSLARLEATELLSDVSTLRVALELFVQEQTRPRRQGRKNIALKWVQDLGPGAAAAITWRAVLGCFSGKPYVKVGWASRRVAGLSRLELTARAVKAAGGKHGIARTTYREAKRLALEEIRFSPGEALHLGAFLIDQLVESTGLVRMEQRTLGKNSRPNCLVLTDAAFQAVSHNRQDLWPIQAPMLVPPGEWSAGRGAYHYALMHQFPLLRGSQGKDPSIPLVRSGLDQLQATEWAINKPVLEYAQRELADVRDIRTSRTLYMAEELAESRLYFPHSCDWRGRIYPMGEWLSINSDDLARGLLRFSNGKPLGDTGARWLALHGANRFGRSGTIDDRVSWVHAHSEELESAAKNPDESELLQGVRKRFQAYAFAREWAAYVEAERGGHGRAFVSDLPCEQDATCNGIQHLAALWRDEDLGQRVNLVDGPGPRDVYTDVMNETRKRLEADPAEPFTDPWWVNQWWRHNNWSALTRAIFKGPTMTFPYGVSLFGMRRAIENSLKRTINERTDRDWRPTKLTDEERAASEAGREAFIAWDAEQPPVPPPSDDEIAEWIELDALGLVPLLNGRPVSAAYYFLSSQLAAKALWATLRSTAPTLVKGCEWFQKVGRAIAKNGQPARWSVPITNFQVIQNRGAYWVRKNHRVQSPLGRLVDLRPTEKVNAKKQSIALAANVIHSLDAAALVLTLRQLSRLGITSIASVHDAFWVLAADASALAQAGREGFIELHEGDVLTELVQQFSIQAEIPDPPDKGALDISEVRKSQYFMT